MWYISESEEINKISNHFGKPDFPQGSLEKQSQDARLYTANIAQSTAVYQLNVRTFFRAIIQFIFSDFHLAGTTNSSRFESNILV